MSVIAVKGGVYAETDPVTGGIVFSSGDTSVPAITNTTFANLLANFPAASHSGRIMRVTDLGNALFESNGTRWKPINNVALIAAIDASAQMSGVTETVLFQKLLPVGSLQNSDRLRLRYTLSKSGTVEQASIAVRVGTAGTAADAALQNFAAMATTTVSAGVIVDFKRLTATTIKKLGNGSQLTPMTGGATSATHTPVTVPNLDSSAVYFTVTGVMSSTSETLTMHDATLEIAASMA